MASQYTLHRGGKEILIEKEDNFFTAILPSNYMEEDLRRVNNIEQVKRVFGNIFKVRATPHNVDDVMDRLRSNENLNHIVHHAYRPVGDPGTRYYITDAIAVCFKKGTSVSKIEEIAQKHGLNLIREYEKERSFLFQVTKSSGKNPVKLCNDLQEYKQIEYAEPNLVNRFQPAYTPPDNIFNNQWHLQAWDGFNVIRDADVRATQAWDLERGKREVVLAVLDDGFDLTHPDLTGENKVVYPRDFADEDFYPVPVRNKGDYHGTPCAGVAIGEINGEGIVGIAPGCAFMPVRFSLSADDNLLYDIFEFAGRRADVLSCSWGPVPVYAPLSSLLYNQLTDLAETGGPRQKGCVVVFAAGNFNAPVVDVENEGFWWRHPRNGMKQTKGPIRNGHASHPDVICVSASTSLNQKAAYSNWGEEVSVCAPSNNWHPTNPQTQLPGRGIWTADNDKHGLGYESGPYTGRFGGTSSATPLVAGTAALLISANPELTAKEVREILESTTDKITDPNPDVVLGLRKGNYNEKGHSEWFGFGKINAFEAVKKALELSPKPIEEPTGTTTGIEIIAGLVNPIGPEVGQEYIMLINRTAADVSLDGWSLMDSNDRIDQLSGIIPAGSAIKLFLGSTRLVNSGGMLQLKDENGQLVHEVRYTAEEASQEGWLVVFK
ncbi:MAG: S8 family serine peptidase [Saprospiraceae bacterium]|nr:S8 family serine peptidase [Saprospiraceae bacterium]